MRRWALSNVHCTLYIVQGAAVRLSIDIYAEGWDGGWYKLLEGVGSGAPLPTHCTALLGLTLGLTSPPQLVDCIFDSNLLEFINIGQHEPILLAIA